MTTMRNGVLALGAVALCAGCDFGVGGAGSGSTGSGNPEQDIAHWNQQSAQLDARRTKFLGTHVQDLTAVGNKLFWYDTSAFDFKLLRYDDATKAPPLAYTFSVGAGDNHNYRASEKLLVTADPGADPTVYRAYDPGSANKLVASMTMKKPSGAQWNAYAVSGAVVWVVDAETPGQTKLEKWQPGVDTAPKVVTTLESAGAQVGEFWDFGVDGNTMVFIESGRIWKMDIAANKASWLKNPIQVEGDSAVDFRSDGVMFTTSKALMFFDYQQNGLVDVTNRINSNPYQPNPTYQSAAKYYQNFARYKTQVLYIGNMGLFAYDLAKDVITPILLSPATSDLRVDYRYPVALDDGTAFVTGLTSTSGAVGADGPTYKVDLTGILH